MLKRLQAFLRDRRGDTFAWVAVVVLFLALPLSSQSIDVVRGMYVRTHLQAAADAACQAAADALDVPTFRTTGIERIKPSLARAHAATVFSTSLEDAARVQFSPSLSVSIISPTVAYCTASASVEALLPLTPSMKAVVETTSEMRVVQRP